MVFPWDTHIVVCSCGSVKRYPDDRVWIQCISCKPGQHRDQLLGMSYEDYWEVIYEAIYDVYKGDLDVAYWVINNDISLG